MRLFYILALAAVVCARNAQAFDWPLWESYASRFIDAQGRVADPDMAGRTTSEGQSYALFFALVAKDRARFDRLLTWTENNLSQGELDSHLPSWSWGKSKAGTWRVLDKNSASDADVWLAYTLFQAGKLWRDTRLTETATAIVNRIAAEETVVVDGFGAMLLPGTHGFEPNKNTYVFNPSYLPLQLLQALSLEAPDGPWKEIARLTPAVLKGSAPKGFALDWVAFDGEAGFRLRPIPADKPASSYDAIRVYLWAGMLDSQACSRDEVLASLYGMGAYLDSNPYPPAIVDEEGHVRNPRGSVGFSAAVIPYLAALKKAQPLTAQMQRLQGEMDPSTGLYGKPARYYDQNLALFATGWSEKLFRFDRYGNLIVSWR